MGIPGEARVEKLKLYERIYVAVEDLGLARHYAHHLLKMGWHAAPHERRGTIYMQQSAFVTALVISYARCFTKSRGWPFLPEGTLPNDQQAISLHKRLINLRHEVYAHSDSKHHKVQPWRLDTEVLTDIRGAPALRFTKAECVQIIDLIDKIRNQLLPTLSAVRADIDER